jgi:DNA/RNA-binding domain of Phe-tRNA-synthetase-like protein
MALPETRHQLGGWALCWARLERTTGVDGGGLDAAIPAEIERLRTALGGQSLSEQPAAALMRQLFRQAGTDPTRYRPSSEALARRFLRGDPFPRIAPLVDLNNLLSLRLLLPCCVLREPPLEPPFELRRGSPGETMDSLRGPFPLDSKPVIADRQGPFSTPITDSRRIAVDAGDTTALLVVYAPAATGDRATVEQALADLAAVTAVARVAELAWSVA